NVISSQFEVHAQFGGIVPELASRCHIEAIWPVVNQAWLKLACLFRILI
ncbi:Glycoprotease family protein, partial [Candidatus Electrothrix communis]